MQVNKNFMEKIKKHFDEEAEEYDDIILTLIPHYHEMIRCFNIIHSLCP